MTTGALPQGGRAAKEWPVLAPRDLELILPGFEASWLSSSSSSEEAVLPATLLKQNYFSFWNSFCFEKSSPSQASFCWQIKYLKAYRFLVKTGFHRAREGKRRSRKCFHSNRPRRTLHSVCPLAGRRTFLWN